MSNALHPFGEGSEYHPRAQRKGGGGFGRTAAPPQIEIFKKIRRFYRNCDVTLLCDLSLSRNHTLELADGRCMKNLKIEIKMLRRIR
jgi:hypothetical protein